MKIKVEKLYIGYNNIIAKHPFTTMANENMSQIDTTTSILKRAEMILNAWNKKDPFVITLQKIPKIMSLLHHKTLITLPALFKNKMSFEGYGLGFLFYYHACQILHFDFKSETENHPQFPKELNHLLKDELLLDESKNLGQHMDSKVVSMYDLDNKDSMNCCYYLDNRDGKYCGFEDPKDYYELINFLREVRKILEFSILT